MAESGGMKFIESLVELLRRLLDYRYRQNPHFIAGKLCYGFNGRWLQGRA